MERGIHCFRRKVPLLDEQFTAGFADSYIHIYVCVCMSVHSHVCDRYATYMRDKSQKLFICSVTKNYDTASKIIEIQNSKRISQSKPFILQQRKQTQTGAMTCLRPCNQVTAKPGLESNILHFWSNVLTTNSFLVKAQGAIP